MTAESRPIVRPLLAWFRRNARDLPWRRTRDPYRIWLSEVILQQTRVEQGLPYYERFFDAFPDVRALAVADEERVFKLWEGLGYYSRARNLHRAAKEIVREHNGRLPRTAEDWRKLPGVGRYTAGAIASIAFGERVPVLDGNVKRVLSRVFNIKDCVDTPATERRLWSLAESLVPAKSPGDFNQAMMELGARVCVPRRPACAECPIARQCEARAAGVEDKRPVRKPKPAIPHEDIAVAVIEKGGRYLLGKRPAGGLLAGLWEFPGVTVAENESHAAALAKGMKQHLGIRVRVGDHVATVTHAYSHLRVTLYVYRCALLSGTPLARLHDEIAWVRLDALSRYALPKANHKFLAAIGEPVSRKKR